MTGEPGARGSRWPLAPEQALDAAGGALVLAAFLVAAAGLAAILDDVSRTALAWRTSFPGALALLAAPGLWCASDEVSSRREAGRRAARVVALSLAIGLTLAVSLLLGELAWGRAARRALMVGALGVPLMLWTGHTLGREDVRREFTPEGAAGPRRWAVPLALYAVFVLSTVGAGFSMLGAWVTGGAPLVHPRFAAAGVFGSAAVTTLGAWLAWSAWRGPDADLELVTPEAWARIVELRPLGAREILTALVRDGVPPPGRRWTLEVVRAVLRTTRPAEP